MTTGNFYVEQKTEKTSLNAIIAALGRTLYTMDLCSGFSTITITGAATTRALPSITVASLPDGITLARAIIAVKFRAVSEHLSSDADLLNNQQIQVRKAVGGTWLTGMTLLDGQLVCLADSRDFGDVFIGNVDIKVQVPANEEVLEVQWLNSRVSAGEIHLEDLQTTLRIWFSV